MPGAAGVVLAGGRSSRMGSAKAGLEWHGSTLLRRAAGVLRRVADGPVVVVRAAGQDLPALPAMVEVADDPREGQGPLQGIAAGLAAVGDRADVAFVCATDLPFLHPAFVRAVLAAARGADVALPVAGGYSQPLAAAYRTALAPLAGRLVGAGRLRPAQLFDECVIRRLDEAMLLADPEVAALDPDLESLLNVNTPDDYQAARDRPEPLITVELLAPSWGPPPAAPWPSAVRAATLVRAAAAVRIAFDETVAVSLNGRLAAPDPELPLACGDTVRFTLPAMARSSSMA